MVNENQFLLEYVNAVLASDAAPADMEFNEALCAELFELSRKLRAQAMLFAMFTSADIKDGIFGPNTADTEFRAKSTWVIIRGNRYQVLEGEFKGTPFRSLPARKKPLIQLGSDYYAVDPCFARDARYRALLFNLLQRKPDYNKAFKDRLKRMSEAAFADIPYAQLPGATVLQEIYYKDPDSKQWSENDTLILLDDVLLLVEARATNVIGVVAEVSVDGTYVQARSFKTYTPTEHTVENAHIYEDAAKMANLLSDCYLD
ncbi:hypothetical protein [Enterobacter hormaechei]|nr:hypothetical protein [Enterobacter hormaechei]